MKLLLVLGSDDNHDAICRQVKPLDYQIIRYRHILKAIDNIDEVDPAAIIVSARDFPRHWKILLQFVRSERRKESCPIIILKGSGFSTEETSKAFFMGANGVLPETLEDDEDITQFQNILKQMPDEGQTQNVAVEPWHRVGLLIADSGNGAYNNLISADIKSISANGLVFSPLRPMPPKAIRLNNELRECSLRLGDTILSPVCRVSKSDGNEDTITVTFSSFPKNDWETLEEYLKV